MMTTIVRRDKGRKEALIAKKTDCMLKILPDYLHDPDFLLAFGEQRQSGLGHDRMYDYPTIRDLQLWPIPQRR